MNIVPNAFILLSHERSGSHFVGEFLSTLADFRMYDEVCNPDAVKPSKHRESFYRFKYEALQVNPNLLMEPTGRSHREFVASYFAYLRSISRYSNIAVDIKYGHVHNFEWHWWPILERPSLFAICQENDFAIVHLYRENVVEATVSAVIAAQRKIWHSWQMGDDTAADQLYKVPVFEIVRRAQLLERQTNLFKDWTSDNNKMAITYEQASAELGKGGELDETLTKFMGAPLRKPFEPRVKKLTKPLREVVENFGDLKRACGNAGLARFVE